MELQRFYRELGTYAAVAHKMKRSPETVSRYVQMKGVPTNIRIAVENLSRELEEKKWTKNSETYWKNLQMH